MRLTIENTVPNPDNQSLTKVVVEIPYDDATFEQLVEMFCRAASGIGYAEGTVNRLEVLPLTVE